MYVDTYLRRCRLYFRGRMHCWWIFDFETDYRIIKYAAE
jgi:hypothetical protein